jgi:hypothetical protein
MPLIACADSVTELQEIRGQVLVAGSHGGVIAAWYAAKAGVRAVILNDAGIGKDEAGVAGLRWLGTIGMAAAAADHRSARIGDGKDMLERGLLSRINSPAAELGLQIGMACHDAAVRLLRARAFENPVPDYREGRVLLSPGVWGLDSVGMLEPEDRGRVLVIGSHAALHGGRAQSALSVDAAFALFNDAGGRAVSRLAALEARGVPAAAVDCMSARIGDCRSMWDTGVVSHVNASAKFARPGMSVREAVAAMR